MYFIVNIGWHHENIVPDILETDWNVRAVFCIIENYLYLKMEVVYEENLSGL